MTTFCLNLGRGEFIILKYTPVLPAIFSAGALIKHLNIKECNELIPVFLSNVSAQEIQTPGPATQEDQSPEKKIDQTREKNQDHEGNQKKTSLPPQEVCSQSLECVYVISSFCFVIKWLFPPHTNSALFCFWRETGNDKRGLWKIVNFENSLWNLEAFLKGIKSTF